MGAGQGHGGPWGVWGSGKRPWGNPGVTEAMELGGVTGSTGAGGTPSSEPMLRPLPCATPLKSPWMWPVIPSPLLGPAVLCHPAGTRKRGRSQRAGGWAQHTHDEKAQCRADSGGQRGTEMSWEEAGEGSEKTKQSRHLGEGMRRRSWPPGRQRGLATAPGHPLLSPLSLVSISGFPKKLEMKKGRLPASEGPG